MIKFYAYYSVGGYKDFFLADSEQQSPSTYYLPLLNRQLENNDPIKRAKGEEQQRLPSIKLITVDDTQGMPEECFKLFVHGGYKALYLEIKDKDSRCLIIRDLNNGTSDEMGRSIPYVMAIIAIGGEDKILLDSFAIRYVSNMRDIDSAMGSLLTYDGYHNGIRFDLKKCMDLLYDSKSIMLKQDNYKVKYLIVSSLEISKIVCKELDISTKSIECIFDYNGNPLFGELDTIRSFQPSRYRLSGPEVESKKEEDVVIKDEGDRDAGIGVEIQESADSLKNKTLTESSENSEEIEENEKVVVDIEQAFSEIKGKLQTIERQLASYCEEKKSDDNRILQAISGLESQLRGIEERMASIRIDNKENNLYTQVSSLISEKLRNLDISTEKNQNIWKNPQLLIILGGIVIATIIILIAM